ncbi:MAG: RNA methyltransferase [Clostridiales bacterium]|nr:RNA methyltransferase [Clostridiales bacterium]
MAEIIEITSLDDPKLAPYRNLTGRQLQSSHLFIAESENVILAGLEAGCRPLSLLMERQHITGKGKALVEACAVPVFTGEDDLLESLTGFKLSRGILCAMERPAPLSAGQVLKNTQRIVVLENVVDGTNVGALLRSAAALGADGVLLTPDCCDPLQRRAARVSMGAALRIPWAVCENPLACLKEAGFVTAALALRDNAVSIREERLKEADKLALFLGAEGDGLRQETIDGCDYAVVIPMYHQVNSLNVAAAGAVAFWELFGK